MKAIAAFALLHAGLAGYAASEAAGNESSVAAVATREIVALVEDGAIPGLSIAVVAGGTVVWAESFGLADIEQQAAVRDDTLFRIGSISKPLTATAIAILVEDERLALDLPISIWSPRFAGKGDDVTVRHLLSHRSGIPHYEGDDFLQTTHHDSMTDAMQKFWDKPLLFPPGSRFSYSSFGFNLLGAVIEQVTDMSFIDFVEEQITRPLNPPSIVPDRNDVIVRGRTAFYRRDADGVTRQAPAVANSDLWPGGGYMSNAGDLARFGDAVINGDFLEAATLTILLSSPENTADASSPGYALGWNTGEANGMRWAGYSGSHYGCMANLRVYPEAGIAVATLANINIEQPANDTAKRFFALADTLAPLFTK